MSDARIRARANWLLRQVDAARCEEIVNQINGVLCPEATDDIPNPAQTTMADGIVAVCAVLAQMVLQAPEKEQGLLPTAIAAILDANMKSGRLMLAANAAAKSALAQDAAEAADKAARAEAQAIQGE